MSHLFPIGAIILTGLLLAAIGRAAQGPSAVDRMLAAQLMGTVGVAVLLVWGLVAGLESAVDVALVVALLAIVATVSFVRRGWTDRQGEEPDDNR